MIKDKMYGYICIFIAVLVITSTGTADLSDGLVTHYSFDGNANDSGSNEDHGIVQGQH